MSQSDTQSADTPDEASDQSPAAAGVPEGTGGRVAPATLEQEGEIAADYLEELLDIADLEGEIDMDVENDRATVSIVGAQLPQLVGDGGRVLEALQELTRLAVYRETGARSFLMLDVSGHRATVRSRLEVEAAEAIATARDSSEPVRMRAMTPFERKIVHDAVAGAGLASESEGQEPSRRVVVLPVAARA